MFVFKVGLRACINFVAIFVFVNASKYFVMLLFFTSNAAAALLKVCVSDKYLVPNTEFDDIKDQVIPSLNKMLSFRKRVYL